jgi:exodeoxyribonuclease V beta subunit
MSIPEPLDFIESEIPPGLSVIEASAGTGKTYAISHMVPRLLLEGTVERLGDVLLVTFTNDAARELSARVRRVLETLAAPPAPDEMKTEPGIHRLRGKFPGADSHGIIEHALIEIDQLNVSTIHSFCQRTIQAEGTLCGLPVMPEVITDAEAYIDEALYDLWQTRVVTDPLLASFASNGNWNIDGDLAFVRKAYSMEEFEPVPEALAFEETLERIRNAPSEATPEICEELTTFIEQVPAWNKGGGDEAFRAGHLKALVDGKVITDTGCWAAIHWFAEMDGHITARRNPQKAIRANAAKLQAVQVANEIAALAKRLRWDWQNACVKAVQERVRAALRAGREITQDGLILTLRDALRSPGKATLAQRLRDQYTVALIDESQDTDSRQFEIFKNVFIGFDGEKTLPDHHLIMIGDPKQAIYGFRGADVNTYLSAKGRAAKVFALDMTYRSPQPLVDAVNAFFERPGSLLKERLDFYPATSGKTEDVQIFVDGRAFEGRVEAWIAPDESEDYLRSGDRRDNIVSVVASEIVRLLKSGTLGVSAAKASKLEPRNIAVLTFSNPEAESMADALKQRGVPAIISSGADVMGTDEAQELLCILRAVNEPRRSGLRYAALATRLLGRDIAAIHEIQTGNGKDDEMLGNFVRWQAAWETKGIAAAIALIDRDEGITARIAGMDLGERRVTNFRQLIDLLQAASLDRSSRPEHLLRWLGQEISSAPERGAAEERQMQLESDREAVQVVTMHKAKGLEYDLVFAPFLWSSRPPDEIQSLAGVPEGGKDKLVNQTIAEDPAIAMALQQSQFEDRLRLAYVAMTRAKVRLWIFGGEMGNGRWAVGAHPLDWLLRDPASEVQSPEQFVAWADSAETPGRGSRHLAGLRALFTGERAGLLALKDPPAASDATWIPDDAGTQVALAVLPVPEIGAAWSVTSFSSLTREPNPHGAKDREAITVEPAQDAPVRLSVPVASNSFQSAPGGFLIGTAIHDWMQEWDCSEPDPCVVKIHLEKYRIPLAQNRGLPPLEESVSQMLKALRLATLPGLGCTISEACPSHEASEWHFHLPIKDSINSAKLAEAFARHAHPEHRAYAPRLAALRAQDLRGYLQGFMDRLAFSGNAWGVIDWKTNKLGDKAEAYGPQSMLACAMDSHYLLQTHLYLVALRRYLRAAAPATTLAGAWLVFLRAVEAGSTSGILHIQPGEELLDALDRLFFQSEQV